MELVSPELRIRNAIKATKDTSQLAENLSEVSRNLTPEEIASALTKSENSGLLSTGSAKSLAAQVKSLPPVYEKVKPSPNVAGAKKPVVPRIDPESVPRSTVNSIKSKNILYDSLSKSDQEKLIADSLRAGTLSAEEAALIRSGSSAFKIGRLVGKYGGRALGALGLIVAVYDGTQNYKKNHDLMKALEEGGCEGLDVLYFSCTISKNLYVGVPVTAGQLTHSKEIVTKALSVNASDASWEATALQSQETEKRAKRRAAKVEICKELRYSYCPLDPEDLPASSRIAH